LRTERLAVLVLVAAAACAPRPKEHGTTLHLAGLLGTPQPMGVPLVQAGEGWLGGPRDVTRPTLSLADGEHRSCRVRTGTGAALVFSLALSAPSPGDWTLEVAAGGAPVATEALSAKRWNLWTPFVVPLPAGAVDLRLTAHREGEGAGTTLLLGAPRIERRPTERAPRVIVWISQDALGAGHLDAYGYPRSTTPFFTRRAKDMVLFEDAVAPATWTLPSLASTFTSRYPPFHGAVLEEVARDQSTPTLFQVLSSEGFTTLAVTGNRFVGPYFHMVDGLDAVFYTPGHADDIVGRAEEALDEWQGGDLVLFVHFMDTHFPYEPPAPYATAFDQGYPGPYDGRTFFANRDRLKPRDVEHVRALYDGAALFADDQIRRLLEVLRSRGIPGDAVSVYTADHGEGFLEHGRFLHAGTVYTELTRVPFALSLPGAVPRRIRDVVSLVDLAPTLLDAFGIPAPPSFSGRSLLPLVRGGGLPARPALSETQVTNNNKFWKVAACDPSSCLLVKLPRGADPADGLTTEERFDRRTDPGETTPLPPQDGALRTFVRAYLRAAHAQAAPSSKAEMPPDVRERLRALGYLHD
jgi:arylsulfatase A-like enzyme